MPSPIYLDYNATTPTDPEVAEAMRPHLYEEFGNPSSPHVYGRKAREAVEEARGRVAALVGASPAEIVFTSGGSESNNTAIFGTARARRKDGRRIVTSAVEHPAVLAPCRALERDGWDLEVVGVDERGRVDAGAVEAALDDGTVLVTVMHANNEVGTIQPVAAIARAARAAGVWIHTDAAQSIGKIPVDVNELGVDLLTVAGHKVYAPKGIGALYVRDGIEIPPLVYGATHEDGRRAGTENVLEIVGLGKACEIAAARLDASAEAARRLRDRLWDGLRAARPDALRHGDPEHALPNTLSVSFPGQTATDLLTRLENEVAASAGAACHGEGVSVSSVLVAMGVPTAVALATLRFSVGRFTTGAEVDEACRHVTRAVDASGR